MHARSSIELIIQLEKLRTNIDNYKLPNFCLDPLKKIIK